MTLDSGKKKEGKGSFWKAFCDLHARSGSVPDARLRDLGNRRAQRLPTRGLKEGRNKIARTGIPEMAPQRLEKIESAPGNGAPPGRSIRKPAPWRLRSAAEPRRR